MFRLFELVFFTFAFEKKGLCDPTLPFIKTVGPEVYKGEILVVLVSKVTIAVGAWAFCSLTRRASLSIPTNLATSLDTRERSDAMTILEKRGICTFISPRVRSGPLRSLGPDVTGDRSEGSELTLIFACTPYFGIIAGLAFPEPPRVAGIRSRVGSFCDCRSIHGFRNWRG